ncbi:MAG TPA: carbohydrate ABC transporter permease [Anaerolineales bacterium]|nr:carbohydrate ABC transporter permease [Anaerolineales bacterium]
MRRIDTVPRQRWNWRKLRTRSLQYLVLSLVAVAVLIPIVVLAFGALKTRGEFLTRPYVLPVPPRWENILGILGQPKYGFWTMMRNSLLVMVATTAGVLVLSSLAAFVFARMEFRSKWLIFNFFTLGLMLPISVAILPVYLVLRQTSLTDKLLGVTFVQAAFLLPGTILILRGFFASIPAELQDAAYIDGCAVFDFFWRILLPLARPALAAMTALTMIASWNDLLVPLVVLNNEELWTLPLGTMQFQGQYSQDLALISAFVLLSAVPMILFYLVAERQIVAGLTEGAVRG